MPFSINCPGCSQTLTLKEEFYGKKVRCRCGKLMRMPKAPDTKSASAPKPTVASANQQPIFVRCSSCQSEFHVQPQMAGKTAKCNCGSLIQIPANSPSPVVAPVPVQPLPVQPVVVQPLLAQPLSLHCPPLRSTRFSLIIPLGQPRQRRPLTGVHPLLSQGRRSRRPAKTNTILTGKK